MSTKADIVTTMCYLIDIYGVDGSDASYEITARNEHVARRLAVDRWRRETSEPIFAISTDGRYHETDLKGESR